MQGFDVNVAVCEQSWMRWSRGSDHEDPMVMPRERLKLPVPLRPSCTHMPAGQLEQDDAGRSPLPCIPLMARESTPRASKTPDRPLRVLKCLICVELLDTWGKSPPSARLTLS